MMSDQEIHNICKRYEIVNYTINPDGSIDANGYINMSGYRLSKLPLKFNRINGFFNCSRNKLTSLENCPNEVNGFFDCSSNKLISLDGIPKYIKGSLICYRNPLESLEGYNDNNYNYLHCDNRDILILKHKRSNKLKLIENL